MHPLLCMNVMHDFIYMGLAELWKTERSKKFKMKRYVSIQIWTTDLWTLIQHIKTRDV